MIIPIIMCLIFELFVAIAIYYVAGTRDGSKSIYLLVTLFATFIMLHTFLIEVQSTTEFQAKQALGAQFVGYLTYVIFYFLTTLEVCNVKIKKSYIVSMFIYIFVICSIIITNSYHNLYFSSFEFTTNEYGFNRLTYEYGLLGKINSLAIYVVIILSLVNIFYHYSLWNSSLKKRLNYFIFGTIIGVILYNLFALNVITIPFDYTYFVLAISPLIYTYGTYKHNTFDAKALAIQNTIDYMNTSILILDTDWNYLYSNKRAQNHLKTLRTTTIGENVKNIKNMPEVIKNHLEIGTYKFDFEIEGVYYFVQCTVDIIAIKKKNIAYVLTFVNLTPLKEELDKAISLAGKDPLTGALNRRSFYEILYSSNKISARETMCIAMIDIDNFKNINDTYGHKFGDEVLCSLVNTIKSTLEGESVLCRYGGEEFIIYIPNTNANLAYKKLEEVMNCIRKISIPFENSTISYTVSIGYKITDAHKGFDDIIEQADKALYVAKTTGKNKICNADEVL